MAWWKLLFCAFGLTVPWLPASLISANEDCTHFASPSGGGNGSSIESPYQIADFWRFAMPGDTLCLLDGVYQGERSMIRPTHGLSGQPGKPITVRALHDGKAEIDGQSQRRPVHLRQNHWFVLEGFNAHSSHEPEGNASVVHIHRGKHNVVRRVVAWDAQDGNTRVFGVHWSEHVLLEDVAGFGIARKIFSASQEGNDVTIRRAWGSWDGSHAVGPKLTYTLAYNNYNMLIENAVGTWTGRDMQENFRLICPKTGKASRYRHCNKRFVGQRVDQPWAVFGMDRMDRDNRAKARLLGSLAYVRNGAHFPAPTLFRSKLIDAITFRDLVAYVEPGVPRDKRTFTLHGRRPFGGSDLRARNLIGIGGAAPSVAKAWDTQDMRQVEKPADVEDLYRTANLCYRYQDGQLTDVPLWPWPMDQRIRDALASAGRPAFILTDVVEEMLGKIPAECRGDAPRS